MPKGLYVGAVALGAAAAGIRYAVKGASAQIFGRSVYRGPRDPRAIALTFDDGPSLQSMELASYLEQEKIAATFFQCGANVLRHPEIARTLHEMDHEIGNHTFSHARLCPRLGWQMNFLSPEDIYREFSRAQEVITRYTGAVPTLSRVPYGLRWRGVGAAQRRLGLTGVMWTVIGHDWEWGSDRIARHVLRNASPGGIICLHDGRDTRPNPNITSTIQAVKQIVPRLKQLGYEFKTVSGMLSRTH